MFSVMSVLSFDECPRLLFLQKKKKRNTLQNINKSFNLLIPCAKPKSHIYLAQNKTLTNFIFFLALCDDVWSLPCVLATFGG